MIPVSRLENKLFLAMADPLNVLAIDDVRRITKLEIAPLIASEKAITDKLNALDSAKSGSMEDIIQDAEKKREADAGDDTVEAIKESTEEMNLDQLAASSEEAPVIKLANLIILQAIKDRASDIHQQLAAVVLACLARSYCSAPSTIATTPRRRNPQNDRCSDHYARAMASYGVFLAACGYAYHGPKGRLAFARSSAGDFHGLYRGRELAGSPSVAKRQAAGNHRTPLGEAAAAELGLRPGRQSRSHAGSRRDRRRRATAKRVADGTLTLDLDAETTLRAGEQIEVTIKA